MLCCWWFWSLFCFLSFVFVKKNQSRIWTHDHTLTTFWTLYSPPNKPLHIIDNKWDQN
jgi:hypothetical protein